MWKAPASILCGCLATLPLLGCAGEVIQSQATAVPSRAVADRPFYVAQPTDYSAPAAVLVFLPAAGGDESLARDPAMWAAQGFDVMLPQPADLYRLAADQQAAIARYVAAARALTGAPIWLVGPDPAVAGPPFGHGGVSGVVVTSVTSNSGTCSQSVLYADRGDGAAPQISVRRSGDCTAALPRGGGRHPSVLPAQPPSNPERPRLIEASAVPKDLPPAAKVRRIAQLIKAAPSS